MDIKKHQQYREKVRQVYSAVPSDGIYFNSRGDLNFKYMGANGNIKTTYLDPMVSAVIVNALVPKSGVLIKGGHGGGKTTLVEKVSHMLTGIPESEIESSMIRGNDDQNVNTLIASFKIGKLMTGTEEVLWRKFVTSHVKIIDELNRFPPSVQNALFEILNKGRVEFANNVEKIDDFILFATENPDDAGTYALSKPFVDRFSFCVPAPQIPSAQDQYMLAERYDDKLKDVAVRNIMKFEELKELRKMISEDVSMGNEALIYAVYLTQAISTCERGDYGDKSHNDIPVGERCKGCGFDTPNALCKMTMSGVSGRAFLDFQRWSKAYAWFLNAFPNENSPEVQIETVQGIAPYLLYHRIEPNENLFAKEPYNGSRLKFIQAVIEASTREYNVVKEPLSNVPKVLRGDMKINESKILEAATKNLVVSHHFKPLVQDAERKEFRTIYDSVTDGRADEKALEGILQTLSIETELTLQSQQFLRGKTIDALNKLKKSRSK